MSKHSPGPWRECGNDRGGCQCGMVWSIPRDMMIATAHGKSSDEGEGDTPHDEMVANARLIAGAPRILELLRSYDNVNTEEDARVWWAAKKLLLAEIDGEA